MNWKLLMMIWPRSDDAIALTRSLSASSGRVSVLTITPDGDGFMLASMNKFSSGRETPVQMEAFRCAPGQRIQIIGEIESVALKERE